VTPAATTAPAAPAKDAPLSPAVRRIVEERGLDPAALRGTGPGGRVLKEDALRAAPPAPPAAAPAAAPAAPPAAPAAPAGVAGAGERIVPMNRIRIRIAEKLVRAQQTAAILTTFNEVDMSRVMESRARWKEAFEQKHGVRLGFMSYFARACVEAMRDVPAVNAEIRGTDIVYHDFVHLGVAASTPKGLVVPVVRNAERLDFAGLEREIARLAGRAREGLLTPEELSGGTFTITNGGVFGSLLSTPILNPPQSGILGMHKIEKRAVVVDDAIVVRPMMYLALSYDHRLIDGEQAVTFLVRVKERLEDPERLMLAV
jgi:2-oxoglutarate dehydrogenase E2 component (dihydrolipoamide succinyltransferase)